MSSGARTVKSGALEIYKPIDFKYPKGRCIVIFLHIGSTCRPPQLSQHTKRANIINAQRNLWLSTARGRGKTGAEAAKAYPCSLDQTKTCVVPDFRTMLTSKWKRCCYFMTWICFYFLKKPSLDTIFCAMSLCETSSRNHVFRSRLEPQFKPRGEDTWGPSPINTIRSTYFNSLNF